MFIFIFIYILNIVMFVFNIHLFQRNKSRKTGYLYEIDCECVFEHQKTPNIFNFVKKTSYFIITCNHTLDFSWSSNKCDRGTTLDPHICYRNNHIILLEHGQHNKNPLICSHPANLSISKNSLLTYNMFAFAALATYHTLQKQNIIPFVAAHPHREHPTTHVHSVIMN